MDSVRTAQCPPVYEVGGPTGYDDVVGFRQVFEALRPLDQLPHPEFLLFQSLHVMTEVCWYNVHHDVGRAATHLDEGEYADAATLIQRAVRLQQLTSLHLDHLRESISRADFLEIRGRLPGTDSGLDSPGARNTHKIARYLWQRFSAALGRHGLAVLDLFQPAGTSTGSTQRDLAAVAHAMMAFDDALMDWQQVHQRLVWSRVGGHPQLRRTGPAQETGAGEITGMSGRSVDILDKFTTRLRFPDLWEAAEIVSQTEAERY
jgi:tryptophan 2,3-dioxygenase